MTDLEKMKALAEKAEGVRNLFDELDLAPVGKKLLDCLSEIIDHCRRESRRLASCAEYLYPSGSTVPSGIASEASRLGTALGVTPKLAVLFALIVDMAQGDTLSRSDLAAKLGGSYVQSLVYEKDLDELAQARLITRTRRGNIDVRQEALKAILDDKEFRKPDYSGMTTFSILSKMSRMFRDIDCGSSTLEQMRRDLWEMIEANPETSFAKALVDNQIENLGDSEQDLFFTLVYLYHERDVDSVQWWDLRDWIEDDVLDDLQDAYRLQVLDLQEQGILVYAEKDGLAQKDRFKLADSVKGDLLSDCGGLHEPEPVADLISHDTLAEKELFYDPGTAAQVAELENLLTPERYLEVMMALKTRTLRTGFTCLFYGIPGTGKTETVYQLARRTGRDILAVDVARLKSLWVGESERNLKSLFDRYRRLARNAKVAPILLFNEADAIFGLRRVGADRAVDKMENTLQNIILQEMERLEGILIATTNLTRNLDKAFERRFLYKIHFENPSDEVKARIWQSMMHDLSEDDARRLAHSFNFTGGQIENILRKQAVRSILQATPVSFDDLMVFCREETIDEEGGYEKIGFKC